MIAVLTTLMVLVELLNFQTIPNIFLWEKGHHGNKRLHKVCGHVSVTAVRSRCEACLWCVLSAVCWSRECIQTASLTTQMQEA